MSFRNSSSRLIAHNSGSYSGSALNGNGAGSNAPSGTEGIMGSPLGYSSGGGNLGSHSISGSSSLTLSSNANIKAIQQQYKNLQKYALSYYHSLNEYMYTPVASHYFRKTFSLFDELWTMQQRHRKILIKPPLSLQREDIGMVALRIAQLYYQNYIRTSNIKYLGLAYDFFNVIEERDYFANLIERQSTQDDSQPSADTGVDRSNRLDRPSNERGNEVKSSIPSTVHDYSHGSSGNPSDPSLADNRRENRPINATESTIETVEEILGETVKSLRKETSIPSPLSTNSQSQPSSAQDVHRGYNTLLRYYARFIMTCLFMNRKKKIHWELLPKMKDIVKYYKVALMSILGDKQEDQGLESHLFQISQWDLVIQELSLFLRHDSAVLLDNDLDLLNFRQIQETQFTPVRALEEGVRQNASGKDAPRVRLSSACLISNCTQQIKYSELSISLYRMMLFLEIQHSNRIRSPEKIFLNRPLFSQVFDAMNSCFKKNQGTEATFYFLQADGSEQGLLLCGNDADNNSTWECNYLTPNDFAPLTRKPLFVIIDSDNDLVWDVSQMRAFNDSYVFIINRGRKVKQFSSTDTVENLEGISKDGRDELINGRRSDLSEDCDVLADLEEQEVLSELEEGRDVQDAVPLTEDEGDFFSFFLSKPTVAYLVHRKKRHITQSMFDSMENALSKALSQISQHLLSLHDTHPVFVSFQTNPFLEALLLRTILYCLLVTNPCKEFKSYNLDPPQIYPPLPKDIQDGGVLLPVLSQLLTDWECILSKSL